MNRMITAPAAPSGLVRTNFATTSAKLGFGARVADAPAWASSIFVAISGT